MQMTVSEGLPLNSKYIKMGREVMRGEGGGAVQADGLNAARPKARLPYYRKWTLHEIKLLEINAT